MNLGLRLSLFGNYHEKYLRAYNWEPQAFSQTLAAEIKVDPYSGQLIGLPGTKPIPFNLSNLDPRITNGIVQCGVNGVPAGCVNSHIFNPHHGLVLPGIRKVTERPRSAQATVFSLSTVPGDEANTGSLEGSAPDVLNLTQPFPAGYACIGNFGTNCDISELAAVSHPAHSLSTSPPSRRKPSTPTRSSGV